MMRTIALVCLEHRMTNWWYGNSSALSRSLVSSELKKTSTWCKVTIQSVLSFQQCIEKVKDSTLKDFIDYIQVWER